MIKVAGIPELLSLR